MKGSIKPTSAVEFFNSIGFPLTPFNAIQAKDEKVANNLAKIFHKYGIQAVSGLPKKAFPDKTPGSPFVGRETCIGLTSDNLGKITGLLQSNPLFATEVQNCLQVMLPIAQAAKPQSAEEEKAALISAAIIVKIMNEAGALPGTATAKYYVEKAIDILQSQVQRNLKNLNGAWIYAGKYLLEQAALNKSAAVENLAAAAASPAAAENLDSDEKILKCKLEELQFQSVELRCPASGFLKEKQFHKVTSYAVAEARLEKGVSFIPFPQIQNDDIDIDAKAQRFLQEKGILLRIEGEQKFMFREREANALLPLLTTLASLGFPFSYDNGAIEIDAKVFDKLMSQFQDESASQPNPFRDNFEQFYSKLKPAELAQAVAEELPASPPQYWLNFPKKFGAKLEEDGPNVKFTVCDTINTPNAVSFVALYKTFQKSGIIVNNLQGSDVKMVDKKSDGSFSIARADLEKLDLQSALRDQGPFFTTYSEERKELFQKIIKQPASSIAPQPAPSKLLLPGQLQP